MLARMAKILNLKAESGENFRDADLFAPWAYKSIEFVSGLTDPTTGEKVMSGTGNGNFSPTSYYNREQAIISTVRLFHCFEANYPSTDYYNVTVEQQEHGKITANPTSIYSGGTVALTVTPDDGYCLKKISVTDSQKNVVELTENGGKYFFYDAQQ